MTDCRFDFTLIEIEASSVWGMSMLGLNGRSCLVASFIVAAAVLLSGTEIRAQDLATSAIGTRVSGNANVAGHLVPLPPGDFELVSRGNERSVTKTASGGTYGAGDNVGLVNIFLVSAPAARFDIGVFISTNLTPNNEGWFRPPNICARKDAFFAYADNNHSPKASDCWIVNYRTFELSSSPSPDYDQFLSRTAALARPNVTPIMYYFMASGGDFATVQYMFNPTRWKIPDDSKTFGQNSWRREPAGKDPAKARVLNLLAGQSQPLGEAIKAGLSKRASAFTWQLE